MIKKSMKKMSNLIWTHAPPPKITKYQDAISSLEDVRAFLDSKGCSEEATKIASSIDTLVSLHSDSLSRQSTLNEYFAHV